MPRASAPPARQKTGKRFVIIGNGLAGHRAAMELRRLSLEVEITLVGAEPGLPYDRPPLTKEFLLGRLQPPDLALKGTARYGDLAIRYHPAVQITEVDRGRRRVAGGQHVFDYDGLLLATGSEPRHLTGLPPSSNVHYIRRIEDSERLRGSLLPGRHVAVIGGGFVGLEVAAAANQLGCEVTVIESRDRLLSRSMPPFVGRFIENQHTSRGVRMRLGETVENIECDGDSILLRLGGDVIRADSVVVGVGVKPNTALAEGAGLDVDGGILVDRQCRTSDPHIFAAGEVTAHPSDRSGTIRRVESWRVANEQPAVAAASMMGIPASFEDPPWLWSDQFGLNMQVIGSLEPGAAYLLHGKADAEKWTLIGIDNNLLPVGAAAINEGRNISLLRRLIRDGLPLPPAMMATCVPLEQAVGQAF